MWHKQSALRTSQLTRHVLWHCVSQISRDQCYLSDGAKLLWHYLRLSVSNGSMQPGPLQACKLHIVLTDCQMVQELTVCISCNNKCAADILSRLIQHSQQPVGRPCHCTEISAATFSSNHRWSRVRSQRLVAGWHSTWHTVQASFDSPVTITSYHLLLT